MSASIIAEDLVKSYGADQKVRALDGLSLTVEEGTVLSLLGPNGSGKTTTVRILATLLRPDSGRASVAGIDVLKHPQKVREVIGLSGQYAAVDETLTGWDNLTMFGRLYHLSSRGAKARADELLEMFSLTDVVIDRGHVIAKGTADSLKKEVGGERLEISVPAENLAQTRQLVESLTRSTATEDFQMHRISVAAPGGTATLVEALRQLDTAGIHPLDIALKRPSLDDVFLALTGHSAEESEDDQKVAAGRSKRGKR
ncbi:MAG: ATP-binding cassette domain-containing protein [Actinobacteria bacterium]|nr:ATP-binding cassette domain-containing protein [Actinomycetota bacterium]